MTNKLFGLHCPDCGKKIEEADDFCPHCGANLNTSLEANELDKLAKQHLEKARISFDSTRNIKRALVECEQALQYNPQSAETHNLRGLILDEMERFDEAILAYREAIHLNPDYVEALENLEDAENEIEALAQEYLAKAQVSFSSSRNLKKALSECEQSLKYAPQLAEAHNLRGLILEDMQRVDEAILAYQEAVRLKPDLADALANLEDAETEYQGTNPKVGAGFGYRLGAQVIDLIVHNIMRVVSGLALSVLIRFYAMSSGTPVTILLEKIGPATYISFLIDLFGYVMYHTVCEGWHGATLGKLIFNLHVLKEDGSPASVGSAFIRSLAFYIDQLFFGIVAGISMGSSKLRQRLGDKWAKTVVVQRSSYRQIEWPSGQTFFITFLIAVGIDSSLYIVADILKLF